MPNYRNSKRLYNILLFLIKSWIFVVCITFSDCHQDQAMCILNVKDIF